MLCVLYVLDVIMKKVVCYDATRDSPREMLARALVLALLVHGQHDVVEVGHVLRLLRVTRASATPARLHAGAHACTRERCSGEGGGGGHAWLPLSACHPV